MLTDLSNGMVVILKKKHRDNSMIFLQKENKSFLYSIILDLMLIFKNV